MEVSNRDTFYAYFGIKKKESDEQRKYTSNNLVAIFKDYYSA